MNELIQAVVETLRSPTGLSLAANQCDEQPDGQPPPMSGQIYYAVHEGKWSSTDAENIDERYGVHITITLRAGTAPKDRHAMAIYRDLRTRRKELHDLMMTHRYVIMNLANQKLGNSVNGFVEPLRFIAPTPIEQKGPDWFSSSSSTPSIAGVACTLVFEDARLVQKLTEHVDS